LSFLPLQVIAAGSKLHKRKRSQQDRIDKQAKRIAKLNRRRGQTRTQQAEQEHKVAVVEEATLIDDSIEELDCRPIPEAWNCTMQNAAEGMFVVLEVKYNRPKGRGITVSQVHKELRER
jgi:hypothetical protein